MENPKNKWMFLAGKIIYFYGPFSMAMLNNQRVYFYVDQLQIVVGLIPFIYIDSQTTKPFGKMFKQLL